MSISARDPLLERAVSAFLGKEASISTGFSGPAAVRKHTVTSGLQSYRNTGLTSYSNLQSASLLSASPSLQSASSSLQPAASRLLGLAGALSSAYEVFRNFGNGGVTAGVLKGAAAGASAGSLIPGVGTLVGGVAGAILGGVGGIFRNTGKGTDQAVRDGLRQNLQQLGLLDKNFRLQLADGTLYDLGKDGGFKLRNIDGGSRRAYETDPQDPLSALAIMLVNPLARLLAGGGGEISSAKASSDLAGLLVNAAVSNACGPEDVRRNVLKMVSTLGFTEDRLCDALERAAAKNWISTDELAAFGNGLETLFHEEDLASPTETVFSPMNSASR